MRASTLALLLVISATPLLAQKFEPPAKDGKPGPYVNIYNDNAVTFQVRRDRIKITGEKAYRVWLRWLWAEPQKWKADEETATVRLVDLDCKSDLRVRELAILHKNRKGEIFDTEELDPEKASWKVLPRDSGAGAAMARVCEFLPQLIEAPVEIKP